MSVVFSLFDNKFIHWSGCKKNVIYALANVQKILFWILFINYRTVIDNTWIFAGQLCVQWMHFLITERIKIFSRRKKDIDLRSLPKGEINLYITYLCHKYENILKVWYICHGMTKLGICFLFYIHVVLSKKGDIFSIHIDLTGYSWENFITQSCVYIFVYRGHFWCLPYFILYYFSHTMVANNCSRTVFTWF